MNTSPAGLHAVDIGKSGDAHFDGERRIHMLAYELWSSQCEGASFPSADAVLNHPQCDFADNALLISFSGFDDKKAQLVSAGKLISEELTCPMAVSDIPRRSIISRISDHYLEAVANGVPIGFEAEFDDREKRHIFYRAIALPCASKGKDVDTVLGFISFRVGAPDSSEGKEGSSSAPVPEGDSPALEKGPKASGSNPTANTQVSDVKRKIAMSFQEKLDEILEIDGALAAALVDMDSGMALATSGNPKGLDLEVAAAGNTNVVKAKQDTMANLGLKEEIEDILITLGTQIHMIRPVTSESGKGLFIYVALDKKKANLAMARHKLRTIEKGLEV